MNPEPDAASVTATPARAAARNFPWLTAAALIIALAALFKASDRRPRLREIVLIDENGAARAVLGNRAEGPFLSLFDDAGKARIAVSLGPEGPLIRLSDADTKRHLGLTVNAAGMRLALIETNGLAAHLDAGRHGARMWFQDGQGWPRMGLGVDDGAPFIGFMDTNLLTRIAMGLDETGGRLSFFDTNGVRRLSLGAYEDRPFLNPVMDAATTDNPPQPVHPPDTNP